MSMFEKIFGEKEKSEAIFTKEKVSEIRNEIRGALSELELDDTFPLQIEMNEAGMIGFDVTNIARTDRTQLDHLLNTLAGLYGETFGVAEGSHKNEEGDELVVISLTARTD